jgi:hypothetical protein
MTHVFNWIFVNQPTWISNLSNLTSITVLGLVVGAWKKLNCVDKGCWRIGRHPVEGTTYHTCKHHTTGSVHERLKKDHARKWPEQHAHLNPKE